ncbi:hypothetical protein GCM10010341_76940 [Streptomyces noursei]|nr:hypothetical protein GCM10010341_76940 [Streptomyces noursei]
MGQLQAVLAEEEEDDDTEQDDAGNGQNHEGSLLGVGTVTVSSSSLTAGIKPRKAANGVFIGEIPQMGHREGILTGRHLARRGPAPPDPAQSWRVKAQEAVEIPEAPDPAAAARTAHDHRGRALPVRP